jgi:hypothetical protein
MKRRTRTKILAGSRDRSKPENHAAMSSIHPLRALVIPGLLFTVTGCPLQGDLGNFTATETAASPCPAAAGPSTTSGKLRHRSPSHARSVRPATNSIVSHTCAARPRGAQRDT